MKKKISIFLRTEIVIIILLALMMPGIATTNSTLLEDTSVLPDAEFKWLPVHGTGLNTIVDNEIILHEIPQYVTLEIYVSDWDPNMLKALQATVDSTSYNNFVGGSLIPDGWPGTPEDGCFIDTTRTDFVFNGMVFIDAVYTGDLDYMWGASLLMDSKADDGLDYYLGTLILGIPADADGTYRIEFIPGNTKTFMQNDQGQFIHVNLNDAYIIINNAPDKPTIDGPTSGKTGEFYDYDFTNCVDPDGDDMTYYVEWDDGGTDDGFVASGGAFSLTHSWNTVGTFTIKAKLIDEFGAESDWAEYDVAITKKSRAINRPFLNWLENHLNIFPLLQTLLQRFGL